MLDPSQRNLKSFLGERDCNEGTRNLFDENDLAVTVIRNISVNVLSMVVDNPTEEENV